MILDLQFGGCTPERNFRGRRGNCCMGSGESLLELLGGLMSWQGEVMRVFSKVCRERIMRLVFV